MKIKELCNICNEQVKKGNGEFDVLFDTEAQCFDTHMVEIKMATFECNEEIGIPNYLCLSYDFCKEPHHSCRHNKCIDPVIKEAIKKIKEKAKLMEWCVDIHANTDWALGITLQDVLDILEGL